MRAICAFLIPAPAVDPPDVLAAADQLLKQRYANAHCGDDNWWDPIECVYPDGSSIAVKNDDTVSGLYPIAERWARLHRRMVDEAIADFVYFANGATLKGRAELEAAFPDDEIATARARTNAALEPMRALIARIEREMRRDVEMVRRSLAAATRVYNQLFAASMVESVPFSTSPASPYEYRAFDLRTHRDAGCMYLVDMHL